MWDEANFRKVWFFGWWTRQFVILKCNFKHSINPYMTFEKAIEKLNIFALAGAGFFLPLSVWFLSAFIFLSGAIWIADKGYMRLPTLFNKNKTVLWALIIYIVPVIWFISNSDLAFGVHDLKIKLPLIVFPLVIGLGRPLSGNELRIVVTMFVAGLITASVIALLRMWGTPFDSWVAERDSVLYISHIRLALMTNLALFSSVSYLVYEKSLKKAEKYFYAISTLWLIYFLFFLLSLTGILLFVILTVGSIIYFAISPGNKIVRYGLLPITVTLVLISVVIIAFQVKSFYKIIEPVSANPELITINGNPYQNYPERKDIENGRYVWMYISEEEMMKEWNSRSSIDYNGKDRNEQDLRFTLIRYLASIGLRKDSVGVSKLSNNDIINIENGIANIRFTEGGTLGSMLYEIIWQIDYYHRGGNPSGHSLTQRIEYFKTGMKIFVKNPLFGVGAGDVPTKFIEQYEIDGSILDPEFRNRSHNQYLTFLISFGIIGFLLIMLSLLIPVFKLKGYKNYLFVIFMSIALLSMLSEDTLETHAGVSFFAYFYSLFLFGKGVGKSSYDGEGY
jgi:hypothetical protein